MQNLPFCLVESGPEVIHSAGDYVLKVKSADPRVMYQSDNSDGLLTRSGRSKNHLLTLYFLGSGAYTQSRSTFAGAGNGEHGRIHQSQISWFLDQSAQVSSIERSFRPDGAEDFSDIRRRRFGKQVTLASARRMAKPNAVMFVNMPLEETSVFTADMASRTVFFTTRCRKPWEATVQQRSAHVKPK